MSPESWPPCLNSMHNWGIKRKGYWEFCNLLFYSFIYYQGVKELRNKFASFKYMYLWKYKFECCTLTYKTRLLTNCSASGSIFLLRVCFRFWSVGCRHEYIFCIMRHRQYQQIKCCLGELLCGTGRLTCWWHGGNEVQRCYSKCHCYVISTFVDICSMLENTYLQCNSSLNRFQLVQKSN